MLVVDQQGASVMRRLANQSREDVYQSNRDYQSLHARRGQQFAPTTTGPARLVFSLKLPGADHGLACWGVYWRSTASTTVEASITTGGMIREWTFRIDGRWRRAGGLLTDFSEAGELRLELKWSGKPKSIDFWGLNIGRPNLPVRKSGDADLALLAQAHLIPETFYLTHDAAIEVDLVAEESKHIQIREGAAIKVKKCSYCGRLLPIDPKRLGGLSFHKHNAKVSKHQNECRACKKWRINDSFNPLRTTDQLHESSVITRERKLFLREPEILQEIKERTGAGLKSKVWERFGRSCFRCRRKVSVDDFQLDHTRPLAYLWPIDEHATCLCANCNNEKKEKFPVDFYTSEQLADLSRITGLSVNDLTAKTLNEIELNRILEDLKTFARDWEPRTFYATSRKIRELRPEIDLLERLRDVDARAHRRLIKDLRERPPAVGED